LAVTSGDGVAFNPAPSLGVAERTGDTIIAIVDVMVAIVGIVNGVSGRRCDFTHRLAAPVIMLIGGPQHCL
jgi:hypothetical protein